MREVDGDGGHEANVEEVRCEFKYSRGAAAILGAAVAATLAIVAAVPFPGEARMAVVALVPALACASYRRITAVRELRLDCRRGIGIRTESGWQMGTLRDGGFVAPWLTIVRWRPEGAWLDRTLLLMPDMLDREDFRAIRVILRWA